MSNVTLGLPLDHMEDIPLKSKGHQSPRDLDIESGLYEFDRSPLTTGGQIVSMEPAISVLQVTIRKPFTIPSLAAITWSLFPYVVPVFSLLSFIRHSAVGLSHGVPISKGYSGFLLFYIFLAVFCVLLNEKVLKRIFQEPRPIGSASKSYGMPWVIPQAVTRG